MKATFKFRKDGATQVAVDLSGYDETARSGDERVIVLAASVAARVLQVNYGMPDMQRLAQNFLSLGDRFFGQQGEVSVGGKSSMDLVSGVTSGRMMTFTVRPGRHGLAGLPVIDFSKRGYGIFGGAAFATHLERCPGRLLEYWEAAGERPHLLCAAACAIGMVGFQAQIGMMGRMPPTFNLCAKEGIDAGLSYLAKEAVAESGNDAATPNQAAANQPEDGSTVEALAWKTGTEPKGSHFGTPLHEVCGANNGVKIWFFRHEYGAEFAVEFPTYRSSEPEERVTVTVADKTIALLGRASRRGVSLVSVTKDVEALMRAVASDDSGEELKISVGSSHHTSVPLVGLKEAIAEMLAKPV